MRFCCRMMVPFNSALMVQTSLTSSSQASANANKSSYPIRIWLGRTYRPLLSCGGKRPRSVSGPSLMLGLPQIGDEPIADGAPPDTAAPEDATVLKKHLNAGDVGLPGTQGLIHTPCIVPLVNVHEVSRNLPQVFHLIHAGPPTHTLARNSGRWLGCPSSAAQHQCHNPRMRTSWRDGNHHHGCPTRVRNLGIGHTFRSPVYPACDISTHRTPATPAKSRPASCPRHTCSPASATPVPPPGSPHTTVLHRLLAASWPGRCEPRPSIRPTGPG